VKAAVGHEVVERICMDSVILMVLADARPKANKVIAQNPFLCVEQRRGSEAARLTKRQWGNCTNQGDQRKKARPDSIAHGWVYVRSGASVAAEPF
jgi:hypothetical protein